MLTRVFCVSNWLPESIDGCLNPPLWSSLSTMAFCWLCFPTLCKRMPARMRPGGWLLAEALIWELLYVGSFIAAFALRLAMGPGDSDPGVLVRASPSACEAPCLYYWHAFRDTGALECSTKVGSAAAEDKGQVLGAGRQCHHACVRADQPKQGRCAPWWRAASLSPGGAGVVSFRKFSARWRMHSGSMH